MFESRRSSNGSLSQVSIEFGQMLDAGREVFNAAADALVGDADPDLVQGSLFAADKGINASQRSIRREILVHAAIQPAADLQTDLAMMSLVKDAERIGDYAKNLFDLARLAPPARENPARAKLVDLKQRLSEHLAQTRRVFESSDEKAARELTQRLDGLENECDREVDHLLAHQGSCSTPATLALAFRHCKRIASHAMNITTAVFMPFDKLDYPDKI